MGHAEYDREVEKSADLFRDLWTTTIVGTEPRSVERSMSLQALSRMRDTATADLTRDVMTAQGISDPAFNALVADVVAGAQQERQIARALGKETLARPFAVALEAHPVVAVRWKVASRQQPHRHRTGNRARHH